MVRFGIIGGGWRSEFFLRVAKVMPGQFQAAGIHRRSKEQGEALSARFGVPYYPELDDLLKQEMDFVIVALPWESTIQYCKKLFQAGIPVLCETPAAPTIETLKEFWAEYERTKPKIQVAEQYFAQPYHRSLAALVERGVIGKPSHLTISMIHGYHGINIMRRLLGTGMERCTISGIRHTSRIAATINRDGLVRDGGMTTSHRDTASFLFEGGTMGYYDFEDEQYFSPLRSRSLRLCGDRGEISGYTVRYLNSAGDAVQSDMTRVDLGPDSSLEGFSLRGILFNGEYLYRNPFGENTVSDMHRLNDEEIALADMLTLMQRYARTGEEFYSFADACQDTYLSHTLAQVMETGQAVTTEQMPWHK